MKRLALIAAALLAGVATFWLVRTARDDAAPPAARDAGPGVTRSDPGPDPGTSRPTAGHSRPQPGDSLAPAGTDPGITRPTAGQAPGSGEGDGPPAGRSFVFEDETRDGAWAQELERELALRMRPIVESLAAGGHEVDIDAIECRRSLCRISLHARDVPALSKMYGALESPEGLYGLADQVLLESVQAESDGQVKTRVTAVFDRD